jgi:hypothetical protein
MQSDTPNGDKSGATGHEHPARVSEEAIHEAAMIREPVLHDPVVLAEGVDEEPIEGNRRLFEGYGLKVVAVVSAFYAAFHMAALNGVSISDWTGIDIPFLPQFPLETWNFRILHIAGALVLGFLLYAAVHLLARTRSRRPFLAMPPTFWRCLRSMRFSWR